MSEQFFRHHVIRFYGSIDVIAMDADGDPHQHVLRTLNNLATNFQQVASLKGFKTKILVVKITLINNGRVQPISIFHNDLIVLLRNHRCRPAISGHIIEIGDDITKVFLGFFVQVRDDNPKRTKSL